MARVSRIRLTGRAMRFINLVAELGHLDEEAISRVVLSLEPPPGSKGTVIADIDVIRPAVAWTLAERLEGAPADSALAEDWALLFS